MQQNFWLVVSWFYVALSNSSDQLDGRYCDLSVNLEQQVTKYTYNGLGSGFLVADLKIHANVRR